MTFASEKVKQSSKRATLVRLNPARDISDDINKVAGSQSAVMAFDNCNRVTVDGTEYTKVASSPSATEFSFDESTKTLTVNFSGTPTVVVAYHYLFYTSGDSLYWHEDPEDTSTSLRYWESRVSGNPVVTASAEDIYESVLSISSSSVVLHNPDYVLNTYLGNGDSFYKKQVNFWAILNGPENIQKLFQGKITGVNLDTDRVTFIVKDDLLALSEKATFNEDNQYIYWNLTNHPNLDQAAQGKPIPFIIGSASQHRFRSTGTNLTGAFYDLELDPDSLLQAVNTNVSENVTTSTNRTWGVGNALNQAHSAKNIATVDNAAGGYTVITLTSGDADFWVGAQCRITGSGTYYVEILNIDYSTGDIYVTKNAGITVNDDLETAGGVSAVVVKDKTDETAYYLRPYQDYTTSQVSIGGTDFEYLKIDFVNNFESGYGLTTLDPKNHEVFVLVQPARGTADLNDHSKVMQILLEAAGLTVDATSFSQAQTDRDVQANFTVPFKDQNDFQPYTTYAGKLCQSVLGIIRINNSFEAEYKILAAPSGGITYTFDDILEGSFTIEIDYNDVIYQQVSTNQHYDSTAATRDINASPSFTINNSRSRHLHEVDKVFNHRHIVEDVNDAGTDLNNIKAHRRCAYRFRTKSLHLDALLGDNAELEIDGLLGTNTARDVVIVGLEKSVDGTTVTCLDLYNLENVYPIVH